MHPVAQQNLAASEAQLHDILAAAISRKPVRITELDMWRAATGCKLITGAQVPEGLV